MQVKKLNKIVLVILSLYFLSISCLHNSANCQNIDYFIEDILPETAKTPNCLAVDQNILWAGTSNGLFKIHNGEYSHVLNDEFKINAISIDNFGNKWLGTYNSSIIKYNEVHDMREFSFRNKVRDENHLVTCLFSKNSEIWAATSEGTIIHLIPANNSLRTIKSPVSQNITALYIGRLNTIWIGTTVGLFYKPHGQSGSWQKHPDFAIVYEILPYNGGLIVSGRNTQNEALVNYFKSIQDYSKVEIPCLINPYAKIASLAQDDNKNILLGLNTGVISLNQNKPAEICVDWKISDTRYNISVEKLVSGKNNAAYVITENKNLFKISVVKKDQEVKYFHSIDGLECGIPLIMPNLKFKADDTTFISPELAAGEIDLLVQYLRATPSSNITLRGHTNIFGSSVNHEMNLSNKRIEVVKHYLTARGISTDRIQTKAFGSSQPLTRNREESEINRRVEIMVICEK